MRILLLIGFIGASVSIAGCQAPGQRYASNVYGAGQVNTRQEATTIEILAVLPAKVQVSNAQNQRAATIAGALIGAIGGGLLGANANSRYHRSNAVLGAAGGGVAGAAVGSLVPSTVLVDGVSIAYKQDGKVYNSAQVGEQCQFHPGTALMVSTGPNETRIQPNAVCPPPASGTNKQG
ncbi:MAG: glycine zipper 2TM domain-containing protein [Candidimonas sp.]|nr:MAG: glycine zipper 2TM domain-containing protein [Candidimonas sp.]